MGKTGTTGTNVDYVTQNGYILYFSDRRGMQFATSAQGANYQTIGASMATKILSTTLTPATVSLRTVQARSGQLQRSLAEDLNGNLVLDNYGVKYVGDAYGTTIRPIPTPPPFRRRMPSWERRSFNPFTIGRANRVTGARHALKLVDGSLGNLPTMPPGNATNNCSQSDC